jgi:hypothetical protein
MEFLKRKITKDQSRDSGMALVLLFLIGAASRKHPWFLFAAIGLHVLNMVWPWFFRPFAVLWLGLSDLLGAISSKISLSIVFVLFLTPIGLLRRMSGKDSLKLRAFKAGQGSVMVQRDHTFTARDMEKPY